MAKQNDGGPAFPRPYSEDKFNEEQLPSQQGMSLRAYLAGQALAGLLPARDSEGRTPVSAQDVEWSAKLAVRYADALLAALQKEQG